jgi:hypothetical protein
MERPDRMETQVRELIALVGGEPVTSDVSKRGGACGAC